MILIKAFEPQDFDFLMDMHYESIFRQKGIGWLLMKNLIELASAEGYRALSLSVDPGNRAAVRLYEGLGFEYCGMSGTSWTMKLSLGAK